MKTKSILFLFVTLIASCAALTLLQVGAKLENNDEQNSQINSHREAELSVRIIPAPNNTYGYDIIMNERVLIHQLHRPALPGNQGFTKKESAKIVAELVIQKIRRHIFPPTISIQELDSLGTH